MDISLLEPLAQELAQARLEGKPCKPLLERLPSLSIEEAYFISKLNFSRRVSVEGVLPIGKKIGLTSRAVQAQLGVHEPDFGYLSSDMLIADKGLLPAGALIQGKVEGEVAFIIEKRLLGPGLKRADIIAATAGVCVAVEVIDSRVENWRIKIQDTIADNASAAYFALGSQVVPLAKVNLVEARMRLELNGQVRSEGTGAACLDDPILAVLWLANCLGKFDVALEPGDIVLSGAYGPVVPVNVGDHTCVSITGLGQVEFTYGA